MMILLRVIRWSVLFALATLLGATPAAFATNGMNLIGFGPESVGMGGADLAWTDSPSAMNINPAGIGQCLHPEIEFGLSLLYPDLRHTDALGNDRDDSLDRYPIPFIGYVHPAGSVTFGAGLFFQGGLGAEYEDLVTPPAALAGSGMLPPGFFMGDSVPGSDDTRTRVAFARFTPSIAWRVHPHWTLGAGLSVGYARAEMRLFPDTSVLADLDMSGTEGDSPRDALFGMDLDATDALGLALRAGFQYRRGGFALGGSYFTETSLDLDGGTMTLNLSALGLGRVRYDATIDGFTWPRQAGVGFGYEVGPAFRFAGDIDWIHWSGAIETLTINMTNPDNPMAPPARSIPFRMDWEDQWVVAMGVEWNPAPRWAVRAGYNHGDTPIPADTLRPLFPAIAEDHLTAGLGWTRGSWAFDAAIEHVLETSMTNPSADPMLNPFGPGATETLSQTVVHFLARKAWGGDGRVD